MRPVALHVFLDGRQLLEPVLIGLQVGELLYNIRTVRHIESRELPHKVSLATTNAFCSAVLPCRHFAQTVVSKVQVKYLFRYIASYFFVIKNSYVTF